VRDLFEYAVVRAVPRVERGECLNIGVLVWCQARGFLGARTRLDEGRLRLLDPAADVELVGRHLAALTAVCAGGANAGAAGELPPGERFRWLTATRSTVVQPSPVHAGLTDDPAAELDRLARLLVDPPAVGGSL